MTKLGTTLTLASALGLSTLAAAPGVAQDEPFAIDVQMHFAQGWTTDLMTPAKAMGAAGFRDGIYWSKIEPTKGTYDFSSVRGYTAL